MAEQAQFTQRNVISGLLFAIIINLAIIWHYKYFPSADGPSHLEIAKTIVDLFNGNCANVNALYKFTPAVVPNWITYVLLIPLMQVFPPEIADKLVVSLYIISLPLLVFNLIKFINPRSTAFAIAACVLVPNYLLFSGSYNFLLSFCLYVYSLRWFLAHKNNLRNWNIIKLALLFLANYLFHLFGFAALAISIFVVFTSELQNSVKTYVKNGAASVLAATPCFILLSQYFLLPKPEIHGDIPAMQRLIDVFLPTTLITMSPLQAYFAFFITAAALFLLIYTAIAHRKSRNDHKYMLSIAVYFVLMILFGPMTFAGGWMIETRLQLYMLLALILWLSGFDYSKRFLTVLSAISLVAIIAQLGLNIDGFEEYNKIASALDIKKVTVPANSTVFEQEISPFTVDYDSGKTNLRYSNSHFAGYMIAEQSCVAEISNYQMGERNSFPVGYKPSTNFNYHLGKFRMDYGLEIIPPQQVDIPGYEKATRVKINYVIIRGRKENIFPYPPEYKLDANKLYAGFMNQVDSGFSPSYQSDNGLLKVYKAKP